MQGEIPAAVRAQAARIRLLVLDVDGVLTDGLLYRGPDGAEFKAFSIRDGHGIRQLLDSGIKVAVISGRAGDATTDRLAELGVRLVQLGVSDKGAALDKLLQQTGVSAAETAYVGDDLPDLPAMRRVGLAVAVADAEPELLAVAHWSTLRSGGRGAVRDVANLLRDSQASAAPLD